MATSGTKLHGKNGAIYLGGAIGSGGTKAATKAEWTLQRNRDYVDATTFGNPNKTYLAGLPNVQGTFAGILDMSGDILLGDRYYCSYFLLALALWNRVDWVTRLHQRRKADFRRGRCVGGKQRCQRHKQHGGQKCKHLFHGCSLLG